MFAPFRPLIERLLGLSLVWGAFLWMTNAATRYVCQSPDIAREVGPGMTVCFLFMLIPLTYATHKIFNNNNNFRY